MSSRRDEAAGGEMFHPDDAMDELFARANPNPDREGCPTDEVLRALALKERLISDPGYEHLAQCSPCYRTFRQFQAELGTAVSKPGNQWRWLVAAAAVVLLLAASAWLWNSLIQRTPAMNESREIHAQMDLRTYAVERSEANSPKARPLVAQRAKLVLTILLPVGSEAGTYELQVMDSELRSQSNSLGEAQIENQVTTLRTLMDLRALSPGEYKLAIRRRGQDWSLFPLHVD
jgi:hypothetical protein